MEDKRGQRRVEGEERRKGHSNLSHVQCLLFFVHISPSCDTLDTMHSNTLTCIATHMGGSHSVGLKPRLFVYHSFEKKKKKPKREPGFEPTQCHAVVHCGLPVVLVVCWQDA